MPTLAEMRDRFDAEVVRRQQEEEAFEAMRRMRERDRLYVAYEVKAQRREVQGIYPYLMRSLRSENTYVDLLLVTERKGAKTTDEDGRWFILHRTQLTSAPYQDLYDMVGRWESPFMNEKDEPLREACYARAAKKLLNYASGFAPPTWETNCRISVNYPEPPFCDTCLARGFVILSNLPGVAGACPDCLRFSETQAQIAYEEHLSRST